MPDLRQDPITGRWVIIATDRSKRPNDYSPHPVSLEEPRNCPFCEGNEKKTPPEVFSCRARGNPNEPGWTVRVVPNKFPALRLQGTPEQAIHGLYHSMNGVGAHEVIVESPEHKATFATLSSIDVANVFFAFRHRMLEFRRDPRIRYAMLFKNHGESAGASLEHTHSQLIALPVVPKQVEEEVSGSLRHFETTGRCIFCEMERTEREDGQRVVFESEHFLAICPYAPRFPFETWILPRVHASHFENSQKDVIDDLGGVMRKLVGKLEKTLDRPAYNAVIHTGPLQGPMRHYHWHIEVVARLTRVAGFEWGSDLPLPDAAGRIRNVSAAGRGRSGRGIAGYQT